MNPWPCNTCAPGSRAAVATRSRPGKFRCSGWKDILWRTYEEIGKDRLLAIAAGTVFYGLLALFPAVTAFVSFYGLFANTSTVNEHLVAACGPAAGRRLRHRAGAGHSRRLEG